MSSKVFMGDIGLAFRATVTDQDGNILDISAATDKTLFFRKPVSGILLTKSATLVTDGADGKMQYVSASGDLDEPGFWKVQGFIRDTVGEWHGDITRFRVYPNV